MEPDLTIDMQTHFFRKAFSAGNYASKKLGVSQTASVRSPYIYAEENWVDDMELAHISLYTMASNPHGDTFRRAAISAYEYAFKEKITPWFGTDTASHWVLFCRRLLLNSG